MTTKKLDVSAWLRLETPRHLELLTKIRETVTAALTPRTEYDADGRANVIPADLNDNGSPARDWCRAYQEYRRGYETLLVEERERAKILVLAQRAGQTPLTDEEYETEMRKLGLEAVREMDDAELQEEIRRRGLTQQQLDPGPDPD